MPPVTPGARTRAGPGRVALALATLLAAAALLRPDAARAQSRGDAPPDTAVASGPGPSRLLDVPYLPQTEALCGGAAAAMVMRYWGGGGGGEGRGGEDATAESFAPLVDSAAGGILTDDLVGELRERGWRATAFRGSRSLVRRLVDGGRPVVALVEVAPGRHHYVVVVAHTEEDVLFHDPARAPFRRLGHGEFRRRWEAAGRWSLLLLPSGVGEKGAPGGASPGASALPDTALPDTALPDTVLRPGDVPQAMIPPSDAAGSPDTADPGGDRRPSGAEGRRPRRDAGHGARKGGGSCSETVRTAVARARRGETAAADSLLRQAAARCPASASPRRELAGLRFRQRRWRDVAAHARAALSAAPADTQAARLLAGSRYMLGEPDAALRAWNRIGRPEVASVRVYGLRHTRWEALRPRLPVVEGRVLTPGVLSLARRRASAVPAFARARVRYRPLRDGTVDVQVAAVERPRLFGSPLDLVSVGLGALTEREVRITAASLAGAGETWSGSWRWWEGRPAVALRASFPGAFGIGGVWTAEGRWEEESFAVAPRSAGSGAGSGSRADRPAASDTGDDLPGASATASPGGASDPLRLERARGSLALERWATGALRWEAGLALDRWAGRESHLSPSAALDLRPVEGRLALRAGGAGWAGLESGDSFLRGSVRAAWRPVASDDVEWTLAAGAAAASGGAPMSLWPGAGLGHARPHLLRGHPLLEDGVIVGEGFGRVLAHGGTEARLWVLRFGPVRAGIAGFVDTARPWDGPLAGSAAGRESGLLVDVGAGLRLAPGGEGGGRLRVDVAGGLADDAGAFSVGWRAPWPGW